MCEMARRIKEERIKAGLTQGELADILGVQKSAIAKYENGRVENIKRSSIEKMAKTFGCSPSYILAFDKPSSSDAELHADLIGDALLMEYMKKVHVMSTSDREKVFSYIDFIVRQN